MKTDGPVNSNVGVTTPSNEGGRGTKSKLVTAIRIGLVTSLAIYWSSMFFGTHLPLMPQSLAGQSDKVLHCGAYLGLATLLLTWRISRGPVLFRDIVLIWLMIGLYGIFDEVTQPLVGRHADIEDWLADLTGAAIGLGITWPVASWLLKRLPTVPDAAQP